MRDAMPTDSAALAEVPVASAISGSKRDEWMQTMAEKFISILRNKTWDLVTRPENRTVIGSRILLRNKYGANGEVTRKKARVVARGFS